MPYWLELGNERAIEGYTDPTSENPDEVKFRRAPGQRVSRFDFPEGIDLMAAFRGVVGLHPHLFEEGAGPSWIESNWPELQMLIDNHHGLQGARRPQNWGEQVPAEPGADVAAPGNVAVIQEDA